MNNQPAPIYSNTIRTRKRRESETLDQAEIRRACDRESKKKKTIRE